MSDATRWEPVRYLAYFTSRGEKTFFSFLWNVDAVELRMQQFFTVKFIRYAALGLIGGSAAQLGCRKPTQNRRIGLSAPAIRLPADSA